MDPAFNFRLTGSNPSIIADDSVLTFSADHANRAPSASLRFHHGSNLLVSCADLPDGVRGAELYAPGSLFLRTPGDSGGVRIAPAGLSVLGAASLSVSGQTTLTGPVTACNDLSVYGALMALGETASASNLVISGSVLLGAGVNMTHDGSNLGINLPPGTSPKCTLHVNGVVCATEEVFELSDRRVKTDIELISDALAKVTRITGCTYLRIGDETGLRHLGVIAQDVHAVAPEAVHMGTDGRMSVAYGNLTALLVEAVKELSRQRENDRILIGELQTFMLAAARP